MARILVTGATGFLGRALIASLVSQKSHYIAAFIRKESLVSLVPPDIRIIFGSLEKIGPLKTQLEGFDVVIHCAGCSQLLPKNYNEMYRTNIDCTVQLARAAVLAEIRHFVFISCAEVITGTVDEITEDSPAGCSTLFGKSKLIAEQELLEICRNSSTNYTILRPCWILGSNEMGIPYQFFWTISKGLLLFLPSVDECIKVSWIHISDVVKAILLVLDTPKALNQTYFLTNGSLHISQISQIAAEALSRSPPFFQLDLAVLKFLFILFFYPLSRILQKNDLIFNPELIPQLKCNRSYSSQKAITELGWTPSKSIDESIKSMIAVQLNIGLLTKHRFSLFSLVILFVFFLYILRLVWQNW